MGMNIQCVNELVVTVMVYFELERALPAAAASANEVMKGRGGLED